LSSPLHVVPPAPDELAALLRLLDDETPQVRARVAERLALCGGDLSEFLAMHPRELNSNERKVLAELLCPARRIALEQDWVAPTGGATALREDWEQFEFLLRVISDFLHDGIAIRQPLSDALDLLAEEAEGAGVCSANDLRAFLFEQGRLKGNEAFFQDPRNSDLAWAIEEGRSNPLGLVVIFVLIARRLDLVVEAVGFPGHFLCRIFEDGYPVIVDCFDHGRMHLQDILLEDPEIGREEREVLRRTVDPGSVLMRLLKDLSRDLQEEHRDEDARLVRKLRASLA